MPLLTRKASRLKPLPQKRRPSGETGAPRARGSAADPAALIFSAGRSAQRDLGEPPNVGAASAAMPLLTRKASRLKPLPQKRRPSSETGAPRARGSAADPAALIFSAGRSAQRDLGEPPNVGAASAATPLLT